MTSRPLTLEDYQQQARLTDHLTGHGPPGEDPRLGPLLGLAGEVGTLLAGYKKYLRDGEAYELFDDNVAEELGDILWYLATAADRWQLSLDDIARANLDKTRDRWQPRDLSATRRGVASQLDASYPPDQQLPRTFTVTIRPVDNADGPEPKVEVIWNRKKRADALGDNTYQDSGYRFHDVFHLANTAVLGWSPVARGKIFGRKRHSDQMIDAVEDGGRAIVIEEGVVAFMFAYASQHNYLEDVTRLDYHTLKTFRTFTSGLEVAKRPLWQVEEAVLQGFAAWRQLRANGGGTLRGDLNRRRLDYIKTLP